MGCPIRNFDGKIEFLMQLGKKGTSKKYPDDQNWFVKK